MSLVSSTNKSEPKGSDFCFYACGMRALEFGGLTELMAKHPDAVSNIKALPDSSVTVPALLIDPVEEALTGEIEQIF